LGALILAAGAGIVVFLAFYEIVGPASIPASAVWILITAVYPPLGALLLAAGIAAYVYLLFRELVGTAIADAAAAGAGTLIICPLIIDGSIIPFETTWPVTAITAVAVYRWRHLHADTSESETPETASATADTGHPLDPDPQPPPEYQVELDMDTSWAYRGIESRQETQHKN
jgi:hypothetical protein